MSPAAALARQPAGGRDGGRVFGEAVGGVSGLSPVISAGRRFVLAGVQWAARRRRGSSCGRGATAGRGVRGRSASVRGHEPDRPGGAGGPVRRAVVVRARRSGAAAQRADRGCGVRVHFVAADARRVSARGSGRTATSPTRRTPWWTSSCPPGPASRRSSPARRGRGAATAPAPGPTTARSSSPSCTTPRTRTATRRPRCRRCCWRSSTTTASSAATSTSPTTSSSMPSGGSGRRGREGSTQPVVGAHAGGYNSVSTGVAVLGTFSAVPPSAAAVAALQRLLAWKLSLHGVPAAGRVRVEVDPSDAFYTPFAPGQRVQAAAHGRPPRRRPDRAAPATRLYRRLPAIRRSVHGRAGAALRLELAAPATTVAPGASVALSGACHPGGRRAGLGRARADPGIGAAGRAHDRSPPSPQPTARCSATVPAAAVIGAARPAPELAPAAVSDLVVIGVAPVLTLALPSTSAGAGDRHDHARPSRA